MSHDPSAEPSVPPSQSRPALDDAQTRQLAAQAHAAAEQALQLARLAQESAEFARKLNSQVLKQTGQAPVEPMTDRTGSVDAGALGPNAMEPAGTQTVLPFVTAGEHWKTKVRLRRSSAHRPPGPFASLESSGSDTSQIEPVQPVRIKVREQDRQSSRTDRTWSDLGRDWKSMLISTALHLLVLVMLGIVTFGIPSEKAINTIIASFADEDSLLDDVSEEPPAEDAGAQLEEPVPVEDPPAEPPADPPAVPDPPPEHPMQEQPESPVELVNGEIPEPAPVTPGELSSAIDPARLSQRTGVGKAYLLEKYGGSAASESAVGRALDWFASVQRRDGSWNFTDIGSATQPGNADSPMGGTSYVLLCFLGAGETHQSGQHQEVVKRGINFLLQNGRTVPAGGDFRGRVEEEKHNFYVQGAATMALAEAASMTGDRRLRAAAQAAVRFIINAQDPGSGGWRYEPRTTGCTSVTALQLLALKSAERAGIPIAPKVYAGVSHFIDTVKCDPEPTGRYCYQAEAPSFNSPSTSQALLCRMYLGAPLDEADLQAGVAILDDKGPYTNRYFCYYASQVLKNWGGREWERWNESLREELLRTQVTLEGPELGSWVPMDQTLASVGGGRLLNTCLCTLTLEVYYRYPPLYETHEAPEPMGEAGK